MSKLSSFVREIEQAIASRDLKRRAESLRKLTDFFVERARLLNDSHVSVFDEVIIRLAREVQPEARIELSARLCEIGNAPVSVVKDLAHDGNVAVAEPVLARSTRLSEDDLVEVADKNGQGHLLAISRRPTLSERLTDVLVNRGDERVMRAVAQNGGAKLSRLGLTTLVEKARTSGDLQGLLQSRLNASKEHPEEEATPPPKVPKEKPEVTAEIRRMETALTRIGAAKAGSRPSLRDLSPALERLSALPKKGLDEAKVAAWIRADMIDEALAAMVLITSLPADSVIKAYDAPDYEPLLVVVRAARFSWNTFKLLLTSKGSVPSPDVLKASFESFQHLPVTNAQQLARRIAADGEARSDAA